MAKAINKMLKAELINYILEMTKGEDYEQYGGDLKPMLKKDLVRLAEQLYAKSLQEEPMETPVEEPVNEADAEEAKYFHMHYQANFYKKLDDGTKTHVDFGCVVTFRLLDDGKWLCDKTSTNNLGWMLDPKFTYKGKWQKGVEREVIGCRTRSVHELKEWLTNGRYGQTVSQYLSQSEMPDYDKCEVGKPIAKGVKKSDVQATSDPVPF